MEETVKSKDIPTVNLSVKSVEVADFNYLAWSEEMIGDAINAMDYKDELQIHRHLVLRMTDMVKMTASAKDGKIYYLRMTLEPNNTKDIQNSDSDLVLDK